VSPVKPVGTTKGPGETPHEYTFITPDREGTAKVGEFVYYETAVGEETRRLPRCVASALEAIAARPSIYRMFRAQGHFNLGAGLAQAAPA
jgi:hypothetical protein